VSLGSVKVANAGCFKNKAVFIYLRNASLEGFPRAQTSVHAILYFSFEIDTSVMRFDLSQREVLKLAVVEKFSS